MRRAWFCLRAGLSLLCGVLAVMAGAHVVLLLLPLALIADDARLMIEECAV